MIGVDLLLVNAHESGKGVPIRKKVDVAVIGGGTSGWIAALAASRVGASTLLVERYGYLGGMLTGGLVTKPTGRFDYGIPKEIFKTIVELGGARGHIRYRLSNGSTVYMSSPMDPEVVKLVAFNSLERFGVKLLLHSVATDPIVTQEGELAGVVVETKSGRFAILSEVVIDCTGDGDIAARSGVPVDVSGRGDGVTQPVTLMFRVGGVVVKKLVQYALSNPEQFTFMTELEDLANAERWDSYALSIVLEGFFSIVEKARREGFSLPRNSINVKTGKGIGEVFINATRVTKSIDPEDLTYAEIELRQQVSLCLNFLRKYMPGFENAYLIDTAHLIGVRESRRIIGEYVLRYEDVISRKKFNDEVVRDYGILDVHQPGGRGMLFREVGEFSIPFRCLYSRTVENLLVAGRCISVDHAAHGVTRNIPICMHTGEAAGVAGALASKLKIMPKDLDMALLQEKVFGKLA